MGQRGVLRLVDQNDDPQDTCLVNYQECFAPTPETINTLIRPYGNESYYSIGYDYAAETGCQLQNFSLTVSRDPDDQCLLYTPGTNNGKMELQFSMDKDPTSYYSIFRMYNERPGYFEDRTEKDLQMGAWGGDGTAEAPTNNQYLAYWNAWGDQPQTNDQDGPPTPRNKFYVGWYQKDGEFFDQMYYHNKGNKPGIFAIDCKNNYSDVLIKSNLSDGSEYCYYKDENSANFGLLGADVVNGGSNGSYSHAVSASASSDDQQDDPPSQPSQEGIPGFQFQVVKPQENEQQADVAFLIGLHKSVPEMEPYMNADFYTPNNYGHARFGYSDGDSNFFRMGPNSAQTYFTVEMGGFLNGKQFIWAYDYYNQNMAWNLNNEHKFHMWTEEGNMLWLSVPAITAGVGEASIWARDIDQLNLLWGSRRDGKLQLYSAQGDYIAHYVKDEASFWYAPAGEKANCKFSSKEDRFQVWHNSKAIYIDLAIGDLDEAAPCNAKFRKVCAGGTAAKGADGKDVYVLATSEFEVGSNCAISYGNPFL